MMVPGVEIDLLLTDNALKGEKVGCKPERQLVSIERKRVSGQSPREELMLSTWGGGGGTFEYQPRFFFLYLHAKGLLGVPSRQISHCHS